MDAARTDPVGFLALGPRPLVIDEVSVIDAYEPWLTLIGLRLVYERNTGQATAPGLK